MLQRHDLAFGCIQNMFRAAKVAGKLHKLNNQACLLPLCGTCSVQYTTQRVLPQYASQHSPFQGRVSILGVDARLGIFDACRFKKDNLSVEDLQSFQVNVGRHGSNVLLLQHWLECNCMGDWSLVHTLSTGRHACNCLYI